MNAPADYQLGGPYPVPDGVRVVTRDHTAVPVRGLYNVCYVNAFQTQTADDGWWRDRHPDLLLRAVDGSLVQDTDWNELVLDISTPARRAALLTVVGPWIDACAVKGFDAVELDNLDSWQRSGGRLTMAQALDYATVLAGYAHRQGLAVAQKNAPELGSAGRSRAGLDFAVAENCADVTGEAGRLECQDYVDVYGDHVIAVEYDDAHYRLACARFGSRLTVIRRDREVSVPGSPSYVFATC